jgi:hypothetical protein
MRMKVVGAIAALAAFAASSGPAIAEPFAFAQAERGSLRVVSGASVGARNADLRGVWLDETVGCDQFDHAAGGSRAHRGRPELRRGRAEFRLHGAGEPDRPGMPEPHLAAGHLHIHGPDDAPGDANVGARVARRGGPLGLLATVTPRRW